MELRNEFSDVEGLVTTTQIKGEKANEGANDSNNDEDKDVPIYDETPSDNDVVI